MLLGVTGSNKVTRQKKTGPKIYKATETRCFRFRSKHPRYHQEPGILDARTVPIQIKFTMTVNKIDISKEPCGW